MSDDPRPVLFVTNYAPAFRVPGFAQLDAIEGVEFALIGGPLRHGGAPGALPARHVPQRAVLRLAASGRYRAVVAGLSGRLAPAAAWLGARSARVPFVLWATLWAHPRSAAHALGYPLVRHLYRDADAIVTYGPHVSDYVRGKGARAPVVEAPQSVDAAFWSERAAAPERRAAFQVLFSGRVTPEKGVDVLRDAWRRAGVGGALVIAAENGPCTPEQMRNFYAGSDVVVVPSIPTATFREPWGLVVNEAMHQSVCVITSDAVGAAAGGLVRHERTGLVVPAGDAGALAAAIRRLHDDAALRERLARAGHEAAAAHTPEAWAAGVSRALAAVGCSRLGGEALLA